MERSPELQELIADWFDALSRGDGAWIGRHISRDADVRLIGSDPSNWEEGERVAEFLTDAVQELGGAIRFSPRDSIALSEGSVGWGTTRAALTLPDGREIDFRWSGVFRQEQGDWKAVQLHGSVGIPDEELLGREP